MVWNHNRHACDEGRPGRIPGRMESPSLDSFRCLNPACPAVGQLDLGNIRHRKWYDTHSGPRLVLRCATCGREFSELKGTALWNLKLPHDRVESIVEHVTRGTSFKGTAELTFLGRTDALEHACPPHPPPRPSPNWPAVRVNTPRVFTTNTPRICT